MRFLLGILVAVTAAAAAPPRVTFDVASPIETSEGHASLEWSADGMPEGDGTHRTYRLEESDDGEFTAPLVRYEGPDRAAFVSGLVQGSTWYRVRAQSDDGGAGPWSPPLEVRTDYPDLSRVVLLMLLGGFVFLATVTMVVVGHLRAVRENG